VPQIVILPHPVFCPEGAVLDGQSGKSICDTLLENDIEIEHACDRVCACTTCHVIVREGFDSLNEQEEKEEDMLDKAWGLEPNSRLSCQAIIADEDLVVEIPKYTINHAAENHRHRRGLVREVPGCRPGLGALRGPAQLDRRAGRLRRRPRARRRARAGSHTNGLDR